MGKQLPFKALCAGMVLASPVLREDGVLLLPSGTKLNRRHLRLLSSWGVDGVCILAETAPQTSIENEIALPPADPYEPSKAELAAARTFLQPWFSHTDLTDPIVSWLFAHRLPQAARLLARRGPQALALPEPVHIEFPSPAPEAAAASDPMDLIEADPKLTSLPDVFVRINEVINDTNSTAQEAADAIGKDTGLSTKLLRLVNSAFYGFPVKVDTLSRAVTLVGSRQLSTLALGISVIAIFKDLPKGLVDMRAFWKHSIACGVIASTLVDPESEIDVERLFVAGLLHDVGRLVLYRNLPQQAAQSLMLARAEGLLLREAEQRAFGFDHATLGGMLLRTWRFPEGLENAVRHHHGGVVQMRLPMSAMTHVADTIAGALGYGSSGEIYVPPLSHAAVSTIGLVPRRLGDVVAAAELQIEDIIRVFLPGDA